MNFINYLCCIKRGIRTKSPRNLPAKIPNPPSLYENQPKKLIDGSLFVRLNEFKRASQDPKDLPPIIEAANYKVLGEKEKREAKELRNANPTYWTVEKLARYFGCSYKFIFDTVLNPSEKEEIKKQIENKFVNLSLHELKGKMVKERIRLDRLRSF